MPLIVWAVSTHCCIMMSESMICMQFLMQNSMPPFSVHHLDSINQEYNTHLNLLISSHSTQYHLYGHTYTQLAIVISLSFFYQERRKVVNNLDRYEQTILS